MPYNHDRPYEHFTKKEFSGKNPPDKNTNKSEASSPGKPVDWKEIKGLEKPWEAKDTSLEEVEESESESEREERDEGEK